MKNKLISLLSLTFLLSLTSCGTPVPNEVNFSIVDLTTVQKLHTEKQEDFLAKEDIMDYCNKNASSLGKSSDSSPNAIELTWNVTNDLNVDADKYYVWVSENSDLTDSVKFETKNRIVKVYNSKISTTYYWKVEAIYNKTSFFSNVSSFVTEDTKVRNIFVEGVENIRDIGGYLTSTGKKMKQGMIYRSAQFNYDKNASKPIISEPTTYGKWILNNQLKIKTDIDIRRSDEIVGITSSPIGNNVKFMHLPMLYENKNPITRSDNKVNLVSFFDALTKKENYPIDFHCSRGTDRTGALAYAIQAICGVSRSDMTMDYYFSNLSNIGTSVAASPFNGMYFYDNQINNYETGTTLQEKAYNYLIDKIGVSKATLDNIVNLLTE